jgi:hypothetical protein
VSEDRIGDGDDDWFDGEGPINLKSENEQLRKENTALKAVLAEVEKQTGQVREILRVAANNMAVLHHE